MKAIDPSNSIFEDLINSDNLYVDKTKYLYNLITDRKKYHFLSRPRRFGKSLMLSTLDAIFRGKKELFKGLYIDSADYDWKEYPIIHIDFSRCPGNTEKTVDDWINDKLFEIADEHKIKLNRKRLSGSNLDTLITQLSKKQKVIILIDEYDYLLSSNINSKNLEKIREVLRSFYSVIKGTSAYIRFCFITGVTKFSKMSIFSAMNNLIDVSMNEEYSTLFGYTQKELEDNFAEYIEEGRKKRGETREKYLALIKKWYDGYRFSPKGETVYNPVSIGLFFLQEGIQFNNYWINTGGMTYLLTEIAKRVKFDITTDIGMTVSNDILQATDIVQMARTEVNKDNFLSLLYQSGYLTIKKSEIVGEINLFTLGYPNEEVERGLNAILLPMYLGTGSYAHEPVRILSLFSKGKTEDAITSLKAVFASIPYHEEIFNAENVVHASFISMMRIMGADIIGEAATNIGRIDCVLTCPDDIYIIEFKFNQSPDKAIAQIRKKRYYEPYLDRSKRIHLLGINFSTEERNIVEWKEEDLEFLPFK